MRPTEPEFLAEWRKWMALGPPRCCHTCISYDAEGYCRRYGMRPPEDFAKTQDACPDWDEDIPF